MRRAGETAGTPRAAQAGYNRYVTTGYQQIGSAETDKARERITTAQGLPIPFQGEAGLTRGQATRDAQQLKFEYEAARDGNQDIQDRRRQQQIVAGQNFDAMEEDLNAPAFGSLEEQGAAVRGSLIDYKQSRKQEVDAAYQEARDAGEMSALVDPSVLDDAGLTETFQMSWIQRGINR